MPDEILLPAPNGSWLEVDLIGGPVVRDHIPVPIVSGAGFVVFQEVADRTFVHPMSSVCVWDSIRTTKPAGVRRRRGEESGQLHSD